MGTQVRHKNRKKLRGLNPRENYTDRLSAKLVPTLLIEGCCLVITADPLTAVISGFLDRSRYFFLQVPQLNSGGLVDPVPDPQLLRKSGSPGKQTRTCESVTRNSDHWTTEAVHKYRSHGKWNKQRFCCFTAGNRLPHLNDRLRPG
jgi:hypothetical protein